MLTFIFCVSVMCDFSSIYIIYWNPLPPRGGIGGRDSRLFDISGGRFLTDAHDSHTSVKTPIKKIFLPVYMWTLVHILNSPVCFFIRCGMFPKSKTGGTSCNPTISIIPQRYHSERTFTRRWMQGIYERLFICSARHANPLSFYKFAYINFNISLFT